MRVRLPAHLLPTLALALAAGLGGLCLGVAAGSVEWPPLPELAARIKTEWPDAPAPAGTQTNAETYLQSLSPRILPGTAPVAAAGPLVGRTNLYAGVAAYVKVAELRAGLGEALRASLASLAATSHPAGLVLDLRFTAGDDYPAAAAAATALAAKSTDALRLGDLALPIQPAGNTSAYPVIVLVNRQTSGAAEALAAAVRATAPISLLIGTNTAGQARRYREVSLAGGASLRVAGDALTLPDGRPLPDAGLAPDVAVLVPESEERIYLANEFARIVNGRAVGSAAGSTTFRLNEAELVRRRGSRRHGDPEDGEEAPRGARRPLRARPEMAPAAELPLGDPVLARAVDILGGLAVPAPASDGDSR